MLKFKTKISMALVRCLKPQVFFEQQKFSINTFSNSNLQKEKNHGKSEKNVSEFFFPKVQELSNLLEIRLPKWPRTLRLSYVWLRDHCRCPNCYNQDTFQRNYDVHLIPMDLKPVSVKTLESHIEILWPDGHESKYNYKFLFQNTFEGRQTALKAHAAKPWTRATFPALELLTVPFGEFKTSSKVQRKLVEAILEHGVGFVSEVPPTVEATRETVEVLSPVKQTFFGEMWSFKANLEHADTAYSNEFLGAHTDTTYFTEACRLQIFHALQAAEDGGETLLVDGFSVAKQFRGLNPDGYKFLSRTYFPSEYIGDNQHQNSLDVIFKHHPITEQLEQFRYNIYDRAPLSSIPYEKVDVYYDFLHKLSAFVRLPMNEFWFKLQPGNVMFVNNWRVMHGRNSYSGPRIMGGCYVDNSDFLSKARILGINVD